MSEPITVDHLLGCARCQGDGHDNLVFAPLTYPVESGDGNDLTHWCSCPTNGEPILLAIIPLQRGPDVAKG